MKKRLLYLISGVIFLTIIYFPVFGHLNDLPIRIYDEARLSINAYEMYKGGDLIVTHFEGAPEMWNTKPPFMIWMQAGLMKILGVNELSVRLPSAIATFLTCMMLVFISIRYIRRWEIGVIATLVLITCQGYISEHGSRTGDYDTLVTFFSLMACYSLFLYTEETNKLTYLYLTFGGLTLAVLTKGIAGMLLTPGLLIYLAIQKKVKGLLTDKHFYFGLLGFICIIFSYYFAREMKNPGYLNAVITNELGGRYLTTIEGHDGDSLFYWQNLINYRFSNWIYLVPCGLAVGLSFKDKKIFRLTLFSFILALSYFLIISFSKTKLEWYDITLFPLLAIIVAISIFFIFDFLNRTELLHTGLHLKVWPFIFIFLLFLSPYLKIFDKTYKPKDNEFYRIGHLLQDAVKGSYNMNNKYLACFDYQAHNLFYINYLKDMGVKTGFKDYTKLIYNDEVLTFQENVKDYIRKNYDFNVTGTIDNITIFKIKDKKHYE
jgi:4-amino-4-deoxy-L-arabinose transferase and related glycosyltransferases of PMT family